jgi:multidrug efflux pump subunit AcrA (membrane-fusion protein)
VATESVIISAMTEGPVVFCPWREGDLVEAGEKLIEIDRGVSHAEVQSAEAALSLAQAKLADMQSGTRPEEILKAEETVRQLAESHAFAKLDLERTASLVESGALPGEALEKANVEFVSQSTRLSSAEKHLEMLKKGPTTTTLAVEQAAVGVARANLALVRAKLAESVIKAPFSGVITRVNVRPGSLAAARSPLIEMINPTSVVVRFAVPESLASVIHTDMKLETTLDAYPGTTLLGKVVRIYPELDQRTRTLTAEAIMDGTTALLPGMFGRVKLHLESADDAVVLPYSAVVTRPSAGQVVFIADAGKARMQPVTTGIEAGSQIQIVTGVQPGDKVVVAGNEKLKDGAAIGIAGGEKSGKDKAAAGGEGQ